MKKLKVDYSLCQGCGACELACSKLWFKEENPAKSAIRIFKNPANGYNAAVCDQCGACIDMCAPMALSRDKNGVVRLDKNKCVGCLICVGECVRDYMYYHDELINPFKCVACGACVKACPNGALSLVDEAE